MRRYSVIISVIALFLFATHEAQPASAVAIGVNPEGKLGFASAAGGKPTDEQMRSRVIGLCMAHGVMHPKIIASTSRRGFGAVLYYKTADGKVGYTASVGAATQQDAVSEASRKAKAAGGRTAKLVRSWNDIPQTVINL
jgi:hypothetical protein